MSDEPTDTPPEQSLTTQTGDSPAPKTEAAPPASAARFSWLTERLKFWREALGRTMWLLILAIWTLFTHAATIRDNFLLPEAQKALGTRDLIARLDWRTWLLGVLVIALAATLEGAYRVYQKRLAEKDRQYKNELDPIKTSLATLEHGKALLALEGENLRREVQRLTEEYENAKEMVDYLEERRAPKLEILFEDKEPYVEYVQERGRIGRSDFWKIYRVGVKNICEDELYSVSVELEGFKAQGRTFEGIPLRMMYDVGQNPRADFSLRPDRIQYVDIVMRQKHPTTTDGVKLTLMCFTRQFEFVNHIHIAEPTTINVVASAAGAKPCRRQFVIYIGEQDELQMKPSEG